MMKRLLGLALCCSLSGLPVLAETIPPQPPTETNSLAMTTEQAAELIHIDKAPVPLSSKLKKRYAAFRVTVTSDYPHPLQLESASLLNGINGQMAADSVHTSKAWALFGLLLFPIGLVIIGLPVLTSINAGNGKAEKEAMGYPNQVSHLDLHQGESQSFTALVSLAQSPQLSLSFRDRDTKQFIRVTSN
jgi:hypothetical protein